MSADPEAELRPRQEPHPTARLAKAVTRLPRYLRLAQALAKEPSLPRQRKAAPGLGYALLPLDLVRGIIPVAGQLDDLAALHLGLRQALRGCAPEVARAHLARAGLTTETLDTDIEAVGAAALWLGKQAARLTLRAAPGSLRLAGRALRLTRRPLS